MSLELGKRTRTVRNDILFVRIHFSKRLACAVDFKDRIPPKFVRTTSRHYAAKRRALKQHGLCIRTCTVRKCADSCSSLVIEAGKHAVQAIVSQVT